MPKRPLTHVFVLSSAILIGVGPYVVRAAGSRTDQGPGANVANIDLQRVYAESDTRKTVETKVKEYGRLLFDRFAETTHLQYLSPEEVSEYSEALNVEKPTDAEKKKIADLKMTSTKRVEEAQTLAAKKEAELTAQDKERLKLLNTYQQQRPQVLDRLQKIYQQMIDEEDARRQREGMAEVRAIVGKLAKDQGFAQVFDTSSLVYTSSDLTGQALQKVKKK